ncbi:hypothetical protein GCM10022393_13510 [Aquimarina addita]|uniref:Adhesin domain-containing protein n=1 Tax=Aquimarina addita TaxID=870485 RepID=A0ABP7XHC0_9FLAO
MKTIYYNIKYLLFLVPFIVLGNSGGHMKGKYTKEKSMNKEFTVNSDALLKINNDFGNLHITAWNENKVTIEIIIKVNGNDEEKVLKKLKGIDVLFESSAQMVSAKTIFDKVEKSWWEKLTESWGSDNLKMEINYRIKVPINNSIDLTNDYGSINLDKIKGNAIIKCDYGQILIGELMGNDNLVKIDYTHNSSIKYMKNGKINADYSDFTLEKGEQIQLIADYSQSKIGVIKELDYNCDYGALTVHDVHSLKGNGDYLDTNIGDIRAYMNVNSDYGSIDVKNLAATTKNIIIKTDYTGVDIGYEPSLDFNFFIKTSYGGITLEDDIHILKKNKENTGKYYEGYSTTNGSGNIIKITTSYGSVNLRKN